MLALVASRTTEARIRGGLAAVYHLTVLAHAEDLHTTIAALSPDLLVIAPVPSCGASVADLIGPLHARWPSLAIVAVVHPSTALARECVALARAGAHEVIVEGVDDTGVALRAVIENARQRTVADVVLSAVSPRLSTVTRPVVAWTLQHGAEAITVVDLAAGFGVHRRTLVKWLSADQLPSPQDLIAWSRLFFASWELERPIASVERVAHTLDYASGNALRNALRRHTGLRITDVRQGGGLQLLIATFLQKYARSTRESNAR